MAGSPLKSPFAGSPFTSGAPGTNPQALARLEQPKLPSAHIARLAAAIARLPNVPSSRGNAKNLFLP